ncbi:MAG: GC-type dockerin domain-anchored protein [Phycisphaerales bacterium]|jgi:hypothetical protein
MKTTIGLASAALLACGAAQAQVIDFEDGFEGQSITDEYAGQGVIFGTGAGSASISSYAGYFGTLSICNATAGGALGDRDLTLIMEFDPPISLIEFDFHSAGSPGADFPIRFYVGSSLINIDSLPQTGSVWFVDLVFDGLASVDRIEIDSGGGAGWLFSLDNISVESTACYADFDEDGSLTIFDFLAFQNAFDAGDLIADCDEDGSLTIFDFLCFQNAFDAGCE